MDGTFFQVRHYGWKYEKVCMSLGISPVGCGILDKKILGEALSQVEGLDKGILQFFSILFDHCQVRAKLVPSAKFELGCQVRTWQYLCQVDNFCQVFLAWYTFH